MKDTDRLLMAIVGGAVVLVVLAFALVARQPTPSYQPEDSPTGVVSNYLLALSRQEYNRAYGYLSSSLEGRPDTVEGFVDHVVGEGWRFGAGDTRESVVFDAEPAAITGDRAVVDVHITRFRSSGLFDSSQWSETFRMRLERADGTWGLVGGDRYWEPCWEDPKLEECRHRAPETPEVEGVAP